MLKVFEKAGTARLFVASLALLASVIALAVYLRPVSGDLPDAAADTRAPVAQGIDGRAEAEALARRLSAHLETHPRDARGWVILARLLAEWERFDEAAQAYAKGLAASSKVAADPAVLCEYADALGMAQGGNLGGRPRELIDRALALDPNHPKALEMAGSSEYARRDYAAALSFWRPLLAAQRPGSQAYAELAAAIARAERLASGSEPENMGASRKR